MNTAVVKMMDGTVLLRALEGSYSSDATVRRQSEEYLLWFSRQEGSVPLLMNVCGHSQVEMELRMAAAIRLKNQVTSGWEVSEASGDSLVIFDSDKVHLIENIYPLIVSVGAGGRGIRRQCLELLRHLFFHIDVSQVTGVISQLLSDLEQRSDSDRLQCALLVLRRLSLRYEYHAKDMVNEVDAFIKTYLNSLLKIAEDACSAGLHNTEAAMLVHLTLKCYFSIALLTRPTTDVLTSTMDQWMNLIKFILNYFINSENVKSDVAPFAQLGIDMEDEIGAMEQYKCLKWTMRILNRIASKVTRKDSTSKKEMVTYYEAFTRKTHAVEIGQLIIQLLDVESNKRVTLTNLVHHLIWALLRHLIKVPRFYLAVIQPNLDKIIQVYLASTFTITVFDVENYSADAVNYLEESPEVSFQLYSHRGAAADLIRDICRTRLSHVLPVMHKVAASAMEATHGLNIGSRSQDAFDLNDAQKCIYATFSILGHAGSRLFLRSKDKVVLGSIDGVQIMGMAVGIISTCKNPWLVSKACWLSGVLVKKLKDICGDELLLNLYTNLLELLSSQELIVSVLASEAICTILKAQPIALMTMISNSLGVLLNRVFMLMERIELEAVIGALEVVVDLYPEHTLLHAGPIVSKLAHHLQLAILNDADSDESPSDDRVLVRWTMLQTLGDVLRLVANARAKQIGSATSGVTSNDSVPTSGDTSDVCILSSTLGLLQTALVSGSDSDQLNDYLDEFGLILAYTIQLAFTSMHADEVTRAKVLEIYYALVKVVASPDLLDDASVATSVQTPSMIGGISVLIQATRALIHFLCADFKNPISGAILNMCRVTIASGNSEEADELLASIFDVGCTLHSLPIEFVTGVVQLVTMRLHVVLDDITCHVEFICLVAVLLIYISGEKDAETFQTCFAAPATAMVQFLIEASSKIANKYTRRLVIAGLCCIAKRGLYNVGKVKVCQVILTLAEAACASTTDLDDDEDAYNDTTGTTSISPCDFTGSGLSAVAAPDPNFSATVAAGIAGAPLGTLHDKEYGSAMHHIGDNQGANISLHNVNASEQYDANYRDNVDDDDDDFTDVDSSDFDDEDDDEYDEDDDEEWEPHDQYSSLKGINLHVLVCTTLTQLGSENSGVDATYATQVLEKLARQDRP